MAGTVLWPLLLQSLLVAGTHPLHVHAIHALYQAYKFRKTCPPTESTTPHSKTILSILWIAFGGGTIAGIVLNQVPAWLTIPELLPIYLVAYVMVYWVPRVYDGLLSAAPLVEILFDVNDGLQRGYYLTSTIEAFKASSIQAAECMLGQIMISIIAMTFGGVTYSWAMIPGRALTLPCGDDAMVIGFASLVYILGTQYRILDGRLLIEALGGPHIMARSDITVLTVLIVVIGFLNRNRNRNRQPRQCAAGVGIVRVAQQQQQQQQQGRAESVVEDEHVSCAQGDGDDEAENKLKRSTRRRR
ncbi:hypothetical protein SeMB42_g03368 [Synchytrium endobioticum]|uniref:Uncharacterized protein n=1 Tax=Synchytrium endobioticum TaxID=286115 RepID=A0A507D743_9FUNG|nr:hypothetical protein SeLEV6574_g07926 [Synchytrium endobioticum]TPX47276.1 hypothetical protein SeMB42_g03368 [Synchytrium endobioticum]